MNTLAPERSDRAFAAPVETLFAVPAMHCAGCIAKIEKGLTAQPGIAGARVNFTAKRVTIVHDPAVTVPELMEALARLGFEAQPLLEALPNAQASESRALMKALAVAGFAAMNIMLLSVSVWSGASGGTKDLFHWLSALIALPTVAYSGRPFFRSAWNAVSNRRTNMDVPISLGVLLAIMFAAERPFHEPTSMMVRGRTAARTCSNIGSSEPQPCRSCSISFAPEYGSK